MKIIPIKYVIEVVISENKICKIMYETDSGNQSIANLEFVFDYTLDIIAIGIAECFKSEKLHPSVINFNFHGKKISLYKDDFKGFSETEVLRVIAAKIK